VRIVIELSGRGRKVLAAVILVVVLAIPGVALASHQFPDVTNANPFHDDISAIALAGITTGCGGGNFCPTGVLTRQQEAAFIHRASGRVGADDAFGLAVAPGVDVNVAALTITTGLPGGTIGGANGFLKIDGTVSLYETVADGCDCFASINVVVDGVQDSAETFVYLDNNPSYQLSVGAISASVPVTSGTKTVQLVVNEYIGTETLAAYSSLTALYVPFGSSGTDIQSEGQGITTNGSPTLPGKE
jgi:hypothetical protein